MVRQATASAVTGRSVRGTLGLNDNWLACNLLVEDLLDAAEIEDVDFAGGAVVLEAAAAALLSAPPVLLPPPPALCAAFLAAFSAFLAAFFCALAAFCCFCI